MCSFHPYNNICIYELGKAEMPEIQSSLRYEDTKSNELCGLHSPHYLMVEEDEKNQLLY